MGPSIQWGFPLALNLKVPLKYHRKTSVETIVSKPKSSEPLVFRLSILLLDNWRVGRLTSVQCLEWGFRVNDLDYTMLRNDNRFWKRAKEHPTWFSWVSFLGSDRRTSLRLRLSPGMASSGGPFLARCPVIPPLCTQHSLQHPPRYIWPLV